MTAYSRSLYQGSVQQAYARAYTYHGDLGLRVDIYSAALIDIIEKHSQQDPLRTDPPDLFNCLFTIDLYLAVACRDLHDCAWARFIDVYKAYIEGVANSLSSTDHAAEDLADGVLSDMFLPDRSGRSRIARYDGQISLSSWLRIIITRRAINKQELKWNSVERLDDIPDVPDIFSVERIENTFRANRYEGVILESFREAGESLSRRERFILILRYEDGRSMLEIARITGVHPSTITRQIQQIHRKLHREVCSCLASKYHLSDEAVRECLDDIREHPGHSILALIKDS
jgi:RNA polymerase sigma-70 factor